jgi:hypothetical protein
MQGKPTLITWSLTSLISNLYGGLTSNHPSIPLSLQPMTIFSSSPEGSNSSESPSQNLLNLQPILIRYIYNRHQFSFLFSDEQVTSSAIYLSAANPCYLVGTSYGRIFMLTMFEDTNNGDNEDDEMQQERISPVLCIDSHQGSKVT